MIPALAAPAVCVIDDDPKEYGPILDAFTTLGVGCLHIRGDESAPLPPAPFRGLRVVFTDLHLSSSSGKGAAAHTANVFLKVVSPETGPIAVVIWSKYTNDRVGDEGIPPEDQPTESELFRTILLEAEPRFKQLLIFTELPKPSASERPSGEEWTKVLQGDIEKAFDEFRACKLLWSWEEVLQDAALVVAREVTELASAIGAAENTQLDDRLATIFRVLAREQGGPECTSETAGKHVSLALGEAVLDSLEHSEKLAQLAPHGGWLCEKPQHEEDTSAFASQINGFFLTAAASVAKPFVPGTVFRVVDPEQLKPEMGVSHGEMSFNCYQAVKDNAGAWTKEEWRDRVAPILLEISPACDFHQGTRRQALLIGGLLVPAAGRIVTKRGGAFELLPTFRLRWPAGNVGEEDVFLVFCSRYKLTLGLSAHPDWITPWFRLRDLPTTALRNWHSSHASRVGYVSVR